MAEWLETLEDRPTYAGTGSKLRPWSAGGLLLAIAALLWLLGFVTGLVPWLGYRDYDYRAGAAGIADASSETNLGTSAMVLFEGQTARIDYEVDGAPGEAIYLDVSPWPGIRFSEQMRKVVAGQSGRAEFPITRTGVYHFRVSPTPSSYRDTLRFQASWGAS